MAINIYDCLSLLLKEKEIYRHFKGHIYEIVCIGKNADNLEEEVVYKNVENGEIWIRNKNEFLSEVDHKKYPDVEQKYRFELVKRR